MTIGRTRSTSAFTAAAWLAPASEPRPDETDTEIEIVVSTDEEALELEDDARTVVDLLAGDHSFLVPQPVVVVDETLDSHGWCVRVMGSPVALGIPGLTTELWEAWHPAAGRGGRSGLSYPGMHLLSGQALALRALEEVLVSDGGIAVDLAPEYLLPSAPGDGTSADAWRSSLRDLAARRVALPYSYRMSTRAAIDDPSRLERVMAYGRSDAVRVRVSPDVADALRPAPGADPDWDPILDTAAELLLESNVLFPTPECNIDQNLAETTFTIEVAGIPRCHDTVPPEFGESTGDEVYGEATDQTPMAQFVGERLAACLAEAVPEYIDDTWLRSLLEDVRAYVPDTISAFEARCDPELFVRVCRSLAVNRLWPTHLTALLADAVELAVAGGTEADLTARLRSDLVGAYIERVFGNGEGIDYLSLDGEWEQDRQERTLEYLVELAVRNGDLPQLLLVDDIDAVVPVSRLVQVMFPRIGVLSRADIALSQLGAGIPIR